MSGHYEPSTDLGAEVEENQTNKKKEKSLLGGLYIWGVILAAFQALAGNSHVNGEPMKSLAHASPTEPTFFSILFYY